MSAARPLDNANPTILNPTSSSSSSTLSASSRAFNLPAGSSKKAKLASLWESVGNSEWEVNDMEGAPRLSREGSEGEEEDSEEEREEIDAQEVFDLIRSITDPEHPLTLEQLAVVSAAQIKVYNPPRPGSKSTRGVVTEVNNSIANEDGTALSMEAQDREGKIGEESKVDVDGGEDARILVEFTPTIPHCSMSTLIGLSIRVRLMRALPPRYKVDIRLKEGSHQSENAVNKQLNDKERVHAALENTHLLGVVEGCLASAHMRGVGNVGDEH